MITVAVDAMGGDHAPESVVRGVLAALAHDPGLTVQLVGDQRRIDEVLAVASDANAPAEARLQVHHAPDAIPMAAVPVRSLKKLRQSSIAVCVGLLRNGAAHALFSCGNTGAVAVSASVGLARLPGVRRTGIAVVLPTPGGPTTLIDVGANLAPRPLDLACYATMASVYARAALDVGEPTVGLLNIGTEVGKGGALLSEAGALIAAGQRVRYRGFVEGHDVFRGATEVVVCDAFTGNAVLKVAEGLSNALIDQVKEALGPAFPASDERKRLAGALAGVERLFDYAEYGGAPLLGVEGVVLIGHGRSGARAVANGVRAAARAAQSGLCDALREALAACPAGLPTGARRRV